MRLTCQRAAGFTLIEVMIVVAIVAILASIALPSYAAIIRKAHRAEAQGYLFALAMREQQLMSNERRYTDDISALGIAAPANLASYYTFSVTTPSDMKFVITATAIGAQSADGNLTIDQTDAKGPAGKW